MFATLSFFSSVSSQVLQSIKYMVTNQTQTMPFQRLLTNQRSILLAVCLGVLVLRQTESLALLGHW